MFENKLADIVENAEMSKSEMAKKAGVSPAFLTMCLKGKASMTERVWVALLKEVWGLTEGEAKVQIANWQIEEAKKVIEENGGSITITGDHNEVNFSGKKSS